MQKFMIDQSQKSSHFLSINIKRLIEKAGISVHQLSKNTGLAFPTIKRIIDSEDTNPTLSSLEAIANYFSTSISELLGETSVDNDSMPVLLKKTSWFLVPLLKQEDVIDWPSNKSVLLSSNDIKSITSDSELCQDAFALTVVGSSMEPAIPDKSTVIVDPSAELKHLSFVIVVKEKAKLPQIKQLLIDGPDRYLRTLSTDMGSSSPISLVDETYKVVGVIKEIIIRT